MESRFIVFDGNEGCGKSTQSKLLQQALIDSGKDCILVRDPGSTRIGELVRSILLNPDHDEMGMRCEMLLYMSARAQLMHETILPALKEGKWVICDRFVSSTLAYQLGGDGLSADEIRKTADIAIAGRWPGQILILDMPVEKSIARVQRAKDRIEQRPLEYHAMVRNNFLAQVKAQPDIYKVIDADRSPEVVHAEIKKLVFG